MGSFSDAILSEAILSEAILSEAILSEAILKKIEIKYFVISINNTIRPKRKMIHANMIAETCFMSKPLDPHLQILKVEAIDRIASVVDELPKYKQPFAVLIANFTVEDMLTLMNTIFRDTDFKASAYYRLYNKYFDEIEDLIHRM
jgi:hypothetical protein